MRKQLQEFALLTCALFALSACGGSSSESQPDTQGPITPENQAPTVILSSSFDADEKSTITITANASDSDGTIAGYAWEVTKGEVETIEGADTTSVDIILPEVMADSSLELTLTVTDDDGAVTVTTTTVNVNQLLFNLSLSGLVTDGPIANAQVNVFIEGIDDPIQVTANDVGEYLVNIEVDDSMSDAFAWIIANGVDAQANVGLISLLGRLNNVAQFAGDDNTVTNQENLAVNVTNLSTAQYALLLNNADGEFANIISYTDDELGTALSALNQQDLIDVATAIKAIIDKADENPVLALPEQFDSTLSLAENFEALSDFIVAVAGEAEYQTAREELLEDPNLVQEITLESLSSSYIRVNNQNFGIAGSLYRFFDDGNGDVTGRPFTWSITDGRLKAVFAEDTLSQSFTNTTINGEFVQVEVLSGTKEIVWSTVQRSATTETFLQEITDVRIYPNNEFSDETAVSNDIISYLRGDQSISIDEFQQATFALTLVRNFFLFGNTFELFSLARTEDDFFADTFLLQLNEGGSGVVDGDKGSFSWRWNNGAIEITDLDFSGFASSNIPEQLDKLIIQKVAEHDSRDSFLITALDEQQQRLSIIEPVVPGVLTAAELPVWSNANIPGVYDFNIDSSIFNDFRIETVYQLSEGGVGTRWQAVDFDGGVFNPDIATQPMIWQLNDGKLTVTRYRIPNTGARCTEILPECEIFVQETYTMLAETDTRVTFIRDFFANELFFNENGSKTRALLSYDKLPELPDFFTPVESAPRPNSVETQAKLQTLGAKQQSNQ